MIPVLYKRNFCKRVPNIGNSAKRKASYARSIRLFRLCRPVTLMVVKVHL